MPQVLAMKPDGKPETIFAPRDFEELISWTRICPQRCTSYQDKTEYVLTPNAGQESEYSADEIRERYIAADQTKRLSESEDEEQSD